MKTPIVKNTKTKTEERIIKAVYSKKDTEKTGAFVILEPQKRNRENNIDDYQIRQCNRTKNIIPDAATKTIKQIINEIIRRNLKNDIESCIIAILKPSEDPYIHYYRVKKELNAEELSEYTEVVF